jgi:hypothetical protein
MSHLTAFEIAFQALCEQVKKAKIRDAACLEHSTAATAEWKEANAELTAANKALDTFLSNARNELTRVNPENDEEEKA